MELSKKTIQACIRKKKVIWVEAVSEASIIYNTSYHSTIKMTPYEADKGISPASDPEFKYNESLYH